MQSRRTRREYTALAVVMSVSLLLVASTAKCNKHPPQRTLQEIELDDAMTSKVKQNLTAASPNVRAADIQVTTIRLIVKLEGEVHSDSERTLAIKIASDTEVAKDGTTHKVKQVEAKGLTIKP